MSPEIKLAIMDTLTALGKEARNHAKAHKLGDGSSRSSATLHPKGYDKGIWTGVLSKDGILDDHVPVSISIYDKPRNGTLGTALETVMRDDNGNLSLVKFDGRGRVVEYSSDLSSPLARNVTPLGDGDAKEIFSITQMIAQEFGFQIPQSQQNTQESNNATLGEIPIVTFSQVDSIAS